MQDRSTDLSEYTESLLQDAPIAPEHVGPKRRRQGSGLCLSGGGYRATLFHLGAIRRINELGLLHTLSTVSSVSGGSLLAGRMAAALPWPATQRIPDPDWNSCVAQPVHQLCQRDIRTGPILERLLPWRWRGPPAAYGVAQQLEPFLMRRALTDLPAHPDFVICASDLGNNTGWSFRRNWSGSWLAKPFENTLLDWPLAQAVAVSACFPPVFRPVALKHPVSGQSILLNDGGNYDNLGLEPALKCRELILVSDGGGRPQRRVRDTLLGHLLHYVTLTDTQVRTLRRRWLFSDARAGRFSAVYWAVGQSADTFLPSLQKLGLNLPESVRLAYTASDAQRIASIRTDLNPFTVGERNVLENHGYLMADIALYTYLPAPWRPAVWPDLNIPHRSWLGTSQVAQALRKG